MYLRGILLCMREIGGEHVRLLYHRSYPTSELKASQLHENFYVPFSDFVKNLDGAMSCHRADMKKLFLETDDHQQFAESNQLLVLYTEQYKPVYLMRLPDGRCMWPVVMLEQNDFMVLAVPLVDKIGDPVSVPIHKILALASTYEILISLLDFVSQNSTTVATLSQQRLKDLTLALSVCCPFGMITSTDLQRLRKILRASMMPGAEFLPADLDTESKGTPSFRPVFPADKESVSALLVERISCVQTSESMLTNISGCCWLSVELTSASPNLSIPVCFPIGEENNLQLFVSPHSVIEKDPKSSRTRPSLLLSITPPNDWFPLFLYEAKTSPEPPIFGLLLVKGSPPFYRLTFQLKPSAGIQNVELTELTTQIALPSPIVVSTGKVPGTEPLNSTHGDVGVDKLVNDSSVIIWRLGSTKLPMGDKPATLKGTLSTGEDVDPESLKEVISDIHANLRFSWRGGVPCSGLSMRLADAKVLPARLRPRFALEMRAETVKYRICNTAENS